MSVTRKQTKPKPDLSSLPPEVLRTEPKSDDLGSLPESQADEIIDYASDVKNLILRLEANRTKSVQLSPVSFSGDPVTDSPFLPENLSPERLAFISFVEKLARNGLSTEQIADILAVSPKKLVGQSNRDRALKAALTRGKQDANRLVSESLFRRALGFSYDEVTIETEINSDGETVAKEKRVRKMVLPDVAAQTEWLYNNDSSNWKRRLDVKSEDTKRIIVMRELAALDDAELKKISESQN